MRDRPILVHAGRFQDRRSGRGPVPFLLPLVYGVKRAAGRKEAGRVFLLEPNEVARRSLRRLIGAEKGFSVCGEAAGLEEALERMAAAEPDVAVVSLDALGLSDVAAISRVRWAHPFVPVVAISLRDGAVRERRALQAGAAGYVTKARAAREILPALRKVLKGRIYAEGIRT